MASQRVINFEEAYISSRQQSAKTNLPKKVVNIAESVSYAIKGATAAVVLWYGAPLPITALVVLNLCPYRPKATKTATSRHLVNILVKLI